MCNSDYSGHNSSKLSGEFYFDQDLLVSDVLDSLDFETESNAVFRRSPSCETQRRNWLLHPGRKSKDYEYSDLGRPTELRRIKLRIWMFVASLILFGLVNLYPAPSFAQSESSTIAMATPTASYPATPQPAAAAAASVPSPSAAEGGGSGVLSRMGVGISISPTLGIGAEAAYEVTPRINVRGGFNYFSYTANFNNSGVSYGGTLKLESGEVHLDYFLWHSLHVSPGLMFSPGNLLSANLSVPGGNTFTLSGTTYESSQASPIAGTGSLKFNTVAPSILFGVGNLVPHGNHRFSMKFEIGGAYRGTPTTALNFTGSACQQNGTNCLPISSNPTFQNSVTAQQSKFNNDISVLKFYPIISLGFGFRL